MKIIINPMGFIKTKLNTDSIISNGLEENKTIKKYKNEAIPKIMKKKSALMTHNNINRIKMNNNESINSILIYEKHIIKYKKK